MTQESAFCSRCDKTVRPFVEIGTTGRMVDICPHCQAPVGNDPEPPIAATSLEPVAAPKKAPVPPADILTLARARLAALDLEIAALKTKEAEAATLRRMIAAGENPPN